MNIRNKILTKEEIEEETNRRMKELLSKYPTREHSTLLRFLNESKQIERWSSDKLERLEKFKGSSGLKETSNLKKESLE